MVFKIVSVQYQALDFRDMK